MGHLPEKVSSFFAFNWDAVSKKNVFAAWKASLKLGGSCGVRGIRAVASSLPSASQRSPPFASGRKTNLRGESLCLFTFGRDAGKETNVLAAQEVLLKLGGGCGVREYTVANSSSAVWKRSRPFALHRPPPSDSQRYNILKLTTVQFVNGLRP